MTGRSGILRNPAQAIIEELAYQISIRRKAPLSADQEEGGFSVAAYSNWRDSSLRKEFLRHFRADDVAGKRVLDFGCGLGALSRLADEMGAAQVTGVDIKPMWIEQAKSVGGSRCAFQLERDPHKISLPDKSVDVILSCWMLEHVMTYEDSIREWARVLAPGGRILILWSVWRHPYGHHMHTIVPLPWIHMLLGPAALHRVAARVYDTPSFKPRWWHFEAGGTRKPNFYRGQEHFVDLNCLTTRRFERIAREAGLGITRREAVTGSNPVRRMLARVRPLQDFICAYFVYELGKIVNQRGRPASRRML